MFERSFDALPLSIKEIRDAVGDYVTTCGLGPHHRDAVMLAVSEAATNAVVHGYRGDPGTIRVRAEREGTLLKITVSDEGGGHRPRVDSPGAGLGTPLIALMAERVEIETGDQGTTVYMTFPCPADEAA